MAPPVSSAKIEELRFRLKTDPKSRLFFPLAEELRKLQQLSEAEQVLRTGLALNPSYLSAWVSLGRVLIDQGQNAEAIDVLRKALQLDPGNVVVARLLAETYYASGETLEALKKYKLVHALMPADTELSELVERLEHELGAAPPPVPVEAAPAEAASPSVFDVSEQPAAIEEPAAPEPEVIAHAEEGLLSENVAEPFAPPAEPTDAFPSSESDPLGTAVESDPFRFDASSGYGVESLEVESPQGVHLVDAVPDLAAPAFDAEAQGTESGEESHFFANAGMASDLPFSPQSTLPPPAAEDFSRVLSMADLYVSEGLLGEARDIYEDVLARDPDNHVVREKLAAISAPITLASSDDSEAATAEASETPLSLSATAEPPSAAGDPSDDDPLGVGSGAVPPSNSHKIERLRSWLSTIKRGE